MPLTRGKRAAPARVTGRAVSSCVKGCQRDQVRCVARQVGEVHTRVWDKNHFDLLGLVLLVPLPIVDLWNQRSYWHEARRRLILALGVRAVRINQQIRRNSDQLPTVFFFTLKKYSFWNVLTFCDSLHHSQTILTQSAAQTLKMWSAI